MKKHVFLCLMVIGFTLSYLGCWVEEPAQEYPPGKICFKGQSFSGDIVANSPIVVLASPKGCFSSSCTRAVTVGCKVFKYSWGSPSPVYYVLSEFELATHHGNCTPDCSGGGFAECTLAQGLPPGSYTVKIPDLEEGGTTVTLQVPSERFCVGDSY